MSITVDYFFNHNQTLPELAENINQHLGCKLSPYEGNAEDWFCFFLGMELSLSRHSLENDGDCNFEDYAFHLDFRTPMGNAELRPIQISTMAFIAYVLYCRMKIDGMLVYDMQILLAKYEEQLDVKNSEQALYDLLSNRFVEFPSHLEDLQLRLPE